MKIAKKENLNIENMIYNIRGVDVMLDFDLAKLYQCTNGTKDINKAVKRNIDRFPEDFYFQLDEKDIDNLWFQIGTKKIYVETRGGRLNKPHAFTEQGVAMLSSVLHTDVAEAVSINIMRTFVKYRKYVSNYLVNNEMLINHENRILKLEKTFNKLEEKEKINTIFFDGQIYDAYSLLMDIFNSAKKEIIIIDNYAGK